MRLRSGFRHDCIVSDLLYVPSINPPRDVIHHAILYRDQIASLVPDDFESLLSRELRMAKDSRIYAPLPTQELWQQYAPIQDEVTDFNAVLDLIYRPGLISDPAHERAAWRDSFSWLENSLTRPKMVESFTTGEMLLQEPLPPRARKRVTEGKMDAIRLILVHILARQSSIGKIESTIIPHFDQNAPIADMVEVVSPDDSHLLAQIDVGRLLPDPIPDVDTAQLISFRERYDDERRRLMNSVERLVEDYRKTYGNPAHIERSVKRDVAEALEDMKKAGRGILGGWSRRVFSVVAAAGATAATTAAAGAPAIVTAATSVASGLAINIATNPVSAGWRDDRYKSYHYLYRIRRELDQAGQ